MRSPAVVVIVSVIIGLGLIGAPLAAGYGQRETISSVCFSANSELLAFSFGKKKRPVVVIDTLAGKILKVLAVDGDVTCLDFSPSAAY